MNKTAIKNFAIWARNKLIADITYKAGLLGVTEQEIKPALPQSTKDVQFFDIGTKEPYSISGIEIRQREKLVEMISSKAEQSEYQTAYKAVVEEVAYTWFNRLIAVRFMEVNDYLPSRIWVLSSESKTKMEPDLVTTPFEAKLDYTPYEKDRIMQLTHANRMDELFQILFIKQCNALNAILPNLFEKTSDYTELLLNVSFTDKDGVVYRLVHDIPEEDFKIRTDADEKAIREGTLKEEDAPRGQVEIIGWLYQYYNTEPKDEAFALLKKNVKITKERIPAATQLFTPDWIVRYMVENSLGRLWLERERASSGVSGKYLNGSYFGWKYYLEEAEQEPDVQAQLAKIREEYKTIKPEDIKVIDPCMGSGHILVYAFEVLMQIYESCGYSRRDAARSILAHNIFGLDIDNRAYQLAYFAIMMKAREYNRRILDGKTDCHVYSIRESNGVNRNHLKYFGADMSEIERNTALLQMQGLLDTFVDAKEYGSILNVENYNWDILYRFVGNFQINGQLSLEAIGIEDTKEQLRTLVGIGAMMAQKYDVVVTNPPYMGSGNMGTRLSQFVKKNYPDTKSDMSTVYMEKILDMCSKLGYMSMINIPVWMFLSSYEKLRNIIIANNSITSMIHFGRGIFGSDFGTTAFVIRKKRIYQYIGTYYRLFEKQGAVDTVEQKEKWFIERKGENIAKQETFQYIQGSPIAYWISDSALKAFEVGMPLGDIASPKQGLATTDNYRFVRFWPEVIYSSIGFGLSSIEAAESGLKWFPLNKGGEFRKWYGNNDYVVNYKFDGAEIKANVLKKYTYLKTPEFVVKNQAFYFKENGTWSAVTSGSISVRYSPKGFIISNAGMAIYDENNLKYIIAFMNSKCVSTCLIRIINQSLNFNAGDLERLPLILNKTFECQVIQLADENIEISIIDWDSFETSWNFVRHPLLTYKSSGSLECSFSAWENFTNKQFDKLKANEEELNQIFIDIYGMQDELTPEVENKNVTVRKANLGRDIRSLISYAVGCMFGRYSLDVDGLAYAGGQWNSSKYSTYIPDKDNILPITDEEYFEDDIVGLFVAFVKTVYGEEMLEQNLDFIAKALGNKGNSSREIIRNYFLRDFFKDHCKIYQKRPIYWLFDSGKADGFKALIYLHRYDENTIGNLRIDYLHRMQRVYESEITRMQDTIDNSTNAREVTAAEKRKEKLIKQLKKTKEYDEKIAHLALTRISIDLDDGVKANYEKIQTGTDGRKLEVLSKI